jgi:ABC-type branched-subunit amino acid transport system permease subunit
VLVAASACWKAYAAIWVSPAQAVIGFVAYFATHLRDIHFAITTLIFSQIFYVIIFTWTVSIR